MTIRPAREADLRAVAAIYNAGITERIATFETRPREPDELGPWLGDGRPSWWPSATAPSPAGLMEKLLGEAARG